MDVKVVNCVLAVDQFQVALEVLLLLTMVTISNSIQTPLPQVSYLKVMQSN